MKKELILLSGFLGSGKTTVLQHLIQSSKDKKIAILLNDFGDVPVDGALIENDKGEADIIEIGGGSVFCSCLKEPFVKALFSLAASDVDRVLVEASGMSDPTGVLRMLELAKLDEYYEDAFIICLFDPQKSLKLSHVLEVIPRQVKASHLVVLTKSDVMSQEDRMQATAYVQSISPNVPIIESANGVLDLQECPKLSEIGVNMSLLSFNTPETRPDSFVVRSTIADIAGFIQAVSAYESLLRIKGYAQTKDGVVFISDSPTGIEAVPANEIKVPLTLICMQGQGALLEKQVQTFLS